MFGRPVFGWLPWAPETSKKFVLSGNVLTISWPLMANTKKIKNKKISDLPQSCKKSQKSHS
jgi:hypothetical protein